MLSEEKILDASPVSESNEDLNGHFEDVFSSISTLRNQLTIMQQKLKTLEKNVKKEVKQLKKEISKKRGNKSKAKSGFAKPTNVSNKLCEFMTKPTGTEIARTEVTKYLIQYIQTNNLQNPENKKIITPDDNLKNLLGINEGDELTYFNLQKYMNQHFEVKK